MDDFLGIARPRVNPTIYEHRFQATCNALGFQTKHSKSVTGTTVQFHGLEIDTLAMQARLPPEKLDKAQSLVQHFSREHSIHLAELQSLLGYLSFCAKVIPIGRSFLRRLFDTTRGDNNYTNSAHSHPCPPPNSRPRPPPNSRPRLPPNSRPRPPPIQMTDGMRADLHWWRDFLPAWNGISLIIAQRRRMFLWTDASGTLGQGGVFSTVKPFDT